MRRFPSLSCWVNAPLTETTRHPELAVFIVPAVLLEAFAASPRLIS
jgi:hypothetical protein